MLTRYALRHVATQQFMPEARRGKGYSHWLGPDGMDGAVPGSIRLFRTRAGAVNARGQWARGIVKHESGTDYSLDGPDYWESNDVTDVGRKKDDLEIVTFQFIEVQPHYI